LATDRQTTSTDRQMDRTELEPVQKITRDPTQPGSNWPGDPTRPDPAE